MKPLAEHLRALLGSKATEVSARDAYTLIYFAFERRLDEMDEEVWSPLISGEKFVTLRAKHEQLSEDLKMIEGLLARLEGRTISETAPPARQPRKRRAGYGEP